MLSANLTRPFFFFVCIGIFDFVVIDTWVGFRKKCVFLIGQLFRESGSVTSLSTRQLFWRKKEKPSLFFSPVSVILEIKTRPLCNLCHQEYFIYIFSLFLLWWCPFSLFSLVSLIFLPSNQNPSSRFGLCHLCHL